MQFLQEWIEGLRGRPSLDSCGAINSPLWPAVKCTVYNLIGII